MKERSILLTTEMVRSILADQKTQARWVINPQPKQKSCAAMGPNEHRDHAQFYYETMSGSGGHRIETDRIKCPYGQPGDRLWVRETTIRVEEHGYVGPVYVASDNGQAMLDHGLAPAPDDAVEVEPYDLRLRPSALMPRSMARIILEVTSVRAERLNDISSEDALAEGIEVVGGATSTCPYRNYRLGQAGEMAMHCSCPERSFMSLWESLYGADAWSSNPWVWVVAFRRLEQLARGKAA